MVLLTPFTRPLKASTTKVDFMTFSRLLGLREADRKRKELSEYGDVALRAYRHMCLDGHHPDTKTVYLKPYFYVLNTILHQILCQKHGDSMYIREDSPMVLQRFGPQLEIFSISRYI